MRCMETGVAKGFGAISPSVEKKKSKETRQYIYLKTI